MDQTWLHLVLFVVGYYKWAFRQGWLMVLQNCLVWLLYFLGRSSILMFFKKIKTYSYDILVNLHYLSAWKLCSNRFFIFYRTKCFAFWKIIFITRMVLHSFCSMIWHNIVTAFIVIERRHLCVWCMFYLYSLIALLIWCVWHFCCSLKFIPAWSQSSSPKAQSSSPAYIYADSFAVFKGCIEWLSSGRKMGGREIAYMYGRRTNGKIS